MKIQLFKIRLLVYCTMMIPAFSAFQANAQQKAAAPEINFTSKSYKQVLAAAKSTHKKIFVDAYATWCAPCKELRKTTFKNAKAAAYFNKHYINFSIDVEKGQGPDLAKTWQVEGLPTLLILDENGKVLANHTGFVDGNGLMQFAQEAAETGKSPNNDPASKN